MMSFQHVQYLVWQGEASLVGVAHLVATDEGEAERRVWARLRERFPQADAIVVCCFPLADALDR